MRDMSRADLVSIAALLALGGWVAVSGGLLDEEIAALNRNSGAVMAVAASLTALATGVLAWLNQSTRKLYELEQKRSQANEVRIAGECGRAQSDIESWHRRWERYADEFGDSPIEDALRFNIYLEETRTKIEQLEGDVEGWTRSTNDPDAVYWLGLVTRSTDIALLAIPDEDTDLTRQGFDEWAEKIAEALDHVSENLELAYARLGE